MKTIKETLIETTLLLKKISDSARLDAELLLQFCLNQSRTFLFTYPEKTLTAQEQTAFNNLIEQRLQGVPIAYITGEKEFWSLTLKVSKDTLIPRADTEIIVETALKKLEGLTQAVVIELGTGSGAIAIALATERPDLTLYACDISKEALKIAKINCEQHQLTNIHLLHSDWFSALPNLKADLIISNPPYIDTNCPLIEENVKAYEPELALCSLDKGFKDLLTIIQQSTYYLRHHGYVLLEHGINQEKKLKDMFRNNGFSSIENHVDLQNINRCISAQINHFKN